MQSTNRLTFHNVELRRRNFSGVKDDFNERGNRQVLIVVGKQHAYDLGFDSVTDMFNALKADDWKVKRFNATDENNDPDMYFPATAVYYDRDKSSIFMKTGRNSRLLTEQTVGLLDSADIENTDVILSKHYYDSHGKQGYNVRIKSMEVTVIEDEICARNSMRDDGYED